MLKKQRKNKGQESFKSPSKGDSSEETAKGKDGIESGTPSSVIDNHDEEIKYRANRNTPASMKKTNKEGTEKAPNNNKEDNFLTSKVLPAEATEKTTNSQILPAPPVAEEATSITTVCATLLFK
jgi:hypothetical protein